MGSYVRRRLAWMLPTFLGITLIVFLAVHLAPGDPAALAGEIGAGGSAEQALVARERFRAEHLLDRPLVLQYLHFLGPFDLSTRGTTAFGGSGAHPWHGLLALDFGTEFARPGVSVGREILDRLAVTVPLALLSILLAYGIAAVREWKDCSGSLSLGSAQAVK